MTEAEPGEWRGHAAGLHSTSLCLAPGRERGLGAVGEHAGGKAGRGAEARRERRVDLVQLHRPRQGVGGY